MSFRLLLTRPFVLPARINIHRLHQASLSDAWCNLIFGNSKVDFGHIFNFELELFLFKSADALCLW